MYAALNEQDLLCRVFGECVEGPPLDRELGTLMPSRCPLDAKLFRYARYNAELTPEGLAALGLPKIDPKKVQQLNSVEAIGDLRKIGKAVAAQRVKAEHFSFKDFKPSRHICGGGTSSAGIRRMGEHNLRNPETGLGCKT